MFQPLKTVENLKGSGKVSYIAYTMSPSPMEKENRRSSFRNSFLSSTEEYHQYTPKAQTEYSQERRGRSSRRTISRENLINTSFQRKEKPLGGHPKGEVAELQEVIKRLVSEKSMLQGEIYSLKKSKPEAFTSNEITLTREKAILYQEKEEILAELRNLQKSNFKEKYFQTASELDKLRSEFNQQVTLLNETRKDVYNTEIVRGMKERILSLQAEVETLRADARENYQMREQKGNRNVPFNNEMLECVSEIGSIVTQAFEHENMGLMKLKFLSSLEYSSENKRKLVEILSCMEQRFHSLKEAAVRQIENLHHLQAKADVLSGSRLLEANNSAQYEEEINRLASILRQREMENEGYRRELEKYRAAHEKNMQVLSCIQSQMISIN